MIDDRVQRKWRGSRGKRPAGADGRVGVPDVRPRVLLVEDYRPTLEAFRDALEDVGFEVRGVVDAAGALDALAQQRYDVIVADYELSVVTGVEMLAALRGPMPRTPLILCSGALTPLVEAEARRFGPFAVLGKPFPLDRLVAIVRAAVTRAPRLSL